MLKGEDKFESTVKVVAGGGANASGFGDAYSLSASPSVVRYRAANSGGASLHHACTNFARTAAAPNVALVALLQASEVGGATVLPALGLTVPPKHGRLLLIDTSLSDGSCDPAAAYATEPLPIGAADAVFYKKRFYVDRSVSREATSSEGPSRATPKVTCDSAKDCRRAEHMGAPKGEVVMPLRSFKNDKLCLPPAAVGPCPAPAGYTPPPPKAKPKPDPPPPPPPKASVPGAPPPVA